MNREPALAVGGLVAAGTAVIAVLVAFGSDLTSQQQVAVLGLLAVVAPVASGAWTRFKVWAPATVERLLAARRP